MWTLFAEYNKNGLFNGDEQIAKLLEEVTARRGLNQLLVKRVLMFNKMLKTMDLKLLWIFYSWDIITGTIHFLYDCEFNRLNLISSSLSPLLQDYSTKERYLFFKLTLFQTECFIF